MASPPIRTMLGDLELRLVQRIETEEGHALVPHAVPGLEGDLTQNLNRKTSRIRVSGILAGDDARSALEELRERFHTGDPQLFVADITTATQVRDVVMEALEVRQVSGKPDQFSYHLTLQEFVATAEDETAGFQVVGEQAAQEAALLTEQQMDRVSASLAILEVRVEVGNGQSLDQIAVMVEGTTVDGEPFALRIDEHENGVYRAEGIAAGPYTVRAVPR